MKSGSVVIGDVNRAVHSGCGPGGKGQNAATALTQCCSDSNSSSSSTSSNSSSSNKTGIQHNGATATASAITADSKSSSGSNSSNSSKQQSAVAVQLIMFAGARDATAQSVVQMLQQRGVGVIAGNTAAEMRTCVTLLSSSSTDSSDDGKQQQAGGTEIVGPWGGSITEGVYSFTCCITSACML
jgi:hypothetical protein